MVLLTSRAPVARTIKMGKGDIMKTIYECLLVDGTKTDETTAKRMIEFGIKRTSRRRGCLKGRM